MKLLIAGASGFIGHELIGALQASHSITVLGRDKNRLLQRFSPSIHSCTWEELPTLDAKTYDVIINLSGQNISSRWTEKLKKELIASRVQTSEDLINWAIVAEAKPHFYCANAIGIYGMQKNGDQHAFDEDSTIDFDHPVDFLSEIGVRWQQALQPAMDYGMKVTITRFGVVLKKGEGMLKKLSPSFNLGLGSIVGDGTQVISWIHIQDLINAYLFLLDKRELTGPFNLTSPYPVSQAQFARALATGMHRPLFLKTPASIIRLLFGEMGDCLINKGQRVVPKRLLAEGFQFQYSEIHAALTQEFN